VIRTERNAEYDKIHEDAQTSGHLVEAIRELCETDLFYLLTQVLDRRDVDKDWLYDRCNEVQDMPDEMLDLWAREHYKSTLVTFALSIQEILKNPEITIGIFSHTKPIARAFLRQIKYELESNQRLKDLYPEILWENPKKDAYNAGATWSEEKGLIVKRKSNPKEGTIEANGLVDGMPTSKHYSLLIYDDVVTVESVTSPEMMMKTTDALALSYNLGTLGGRRRFIGTRYHFNDTYATLIDRGTVTPRLHSATHDGSMTGKSVFLTDEKLAEKRRDMGPYVFACQMLQDPRADTASGFHEKWLRFYGTLPYEPNDISHITGRIGGQAIGNRLQCIPYLLVDPANEKRKYNDYTCMMVIGAANDGNFYWLDGIRDRLNLTERTDALFDLHRKWHPAGIGYEKYGMQSDVQHIQYVMTERKYHFAITEVGGTMPKNDRIRRLVPVFEQGRFWMPQSMVRVTVDGKAIDLVDIFIKQEYKAFPVMAHDDMLDCAARIEEPDLKVFTPVPARVEKPRVIRGLTA
jgi:phage terminase large subunit-like protein